MSVLRNAEFKVDVNKTDFYNVLSSFPYVDPTFSVILYFLHRSSSYPGTVFFRFRAHKTDSDITVTVRGSDVISGLNLNNLGYPKAEFEDEIQITTLGADIPTSLHPDVSLRGQHQNSNINHVLAQPIGEIINLESKLVDMIQDDQFEIAAKLLGLSSLPPIQLQMISRKITETQYRFAAEVEGHPLDVLMTHWRWGDDPDQEAFEISWKGRHAEFDAKMHEKQVFKNWLKSINVAPKHITSKTIKFVRSTTNKG